MNSRRFTIKLLGCCFCCMGQWQHFLGSEIWSAKAPIICAPYKTHGTSSAKVVKVDSELIKGSRFRQAPLRQRQWAATLTRQCFAVTASPRKHSLTRRTDTVGSASASFRIASIRVAALPRGSRGSIRRTFCCQGPRLTVPMVGFEGQYALLERQR